MIADVSVDPMDVVARTRVFLDAVLLTDWFFADDARGIARVFVRGDDGRLRLNAARTAVAWVERTGQVRIEGREK